VKAALWFLPLLLLLPCACAKPTATKTPNPIASPATTAGKPDPAAWRNARPKPGERGNLVYPAPEVTRLDNGLTLYVVRRPAGIVEIEFVVRHGASSVPAGKSGLAALTARMLTEGTRKKSSLALAEAVEGLGSTLGSDAGRDYSSVGLSTLRQDVQRGISLIAEVVLTPAFAQKEFERVRAEWLDNLLAERQRPERLASLVGLRLLLGDVQGAPVNGSVPDVKALTNRDLSDFHRQSYVPDSSALILVGDLSLSDAKQQVQALFGKWRALAKTATLLFEQPGPPAKTRVVLVDRADSVQTALFAAQPFPKRNMAGHEARELLSNLLGGLFTSRINQNLREKHAFTYGARSSLLATRLWGGFVVSTSVKSELSAAALVELERELLAAQDASKGRPITEQELLRAKADLINSLGAHLEHTSRVAEDMGVSFVQGLPTDYASRYAALIESLPRELVAREAESRLMPNRLIVVAVGDRKLIQPELERHGFSVESATPNLLE